MSIPDKRFIKASSQKVKRACYRYMHISLRKSFPTKYHDEWTSSWGTSVWFVCAVAWMPVAWWRLWLWWFRALWWPFCVRVVVASSGLSMIACVWGGLGGCGLSWFGRGFVSSCAMPCYAKLLLSFSSFLLLYILSYLRICTLIISWSNDRVLQLLNCLLNHYPSWWWSCGWRISACVKPYFIHL